MALNMPLDKLLAQVGHDGSEILWPLLPEPFKRRAFHIQEMIDVAWWLGRTVTPFEPVPVSQGHAEASPIDVRMRVSPSERMSAVMAGQLGVITGATLRGQPHAVAWDGYDCYDPNGTNYSIERFQIGCFWAIQSR